MLQLSHPPKRSVQTHQQSYKITKAKPQLTLLGYPDVRPQRSERRALQRPLASMFQDHFLCLLKHEFLASSDLWHLAIG